MLSGLVKVSSVLEQDAPASEAYVQRTGCNELEGSVQLNWMDGTRAHATAARAPLEHGTL